MKRLARALVPLRLRILLRQWQRRLALPSARPLPPVVDAGRVTLVGYLTAPTGLGEGARLCAAALAKMGLTVGLIDVTALMEIAGGVVLPSGAGLVVGDAGGPLICHVNPPHLQIALAALKLSGRARHVFAHWVWELPVMGADWRDAFRLVHEAWVPSVYVADALRGAGCAVPIRRVAYPLRAPAAIRAAPVSRPFTVLLVFAFESGFDRKNPLAGIAAFRRAFGERRDVRLVLKIRGASRSGDPERRLRAALDGMLNVTVIDHELDGPAMDELMETADVLLSLHRAEGFGVPLAEAMLRGIPVVATAWSGNLDFMADGSACLVPVTLTAVKDESIVYRGLSAEWAEPSIDGAADWLARLEADAALRCRIGTTARTHAARCLGPQTYAAAVAPALGRRIETARGNDA